ncbi:MAG TPA: hypothetical protein VNO70_23500 [Blastocatellia bacterium]|nr:hypothetical protein [Blastocatellia bacterium]
MALDTGLLEQMTDIQTGGGAAPPAGGPRAQRDADKQRGTDSQEYLKKEERELLDVIKRRAQKREEDEEKRKREQKRKPFQLQPRQQITSLQLSPDEKYVIAAITQTAEGTKNTIVPNYVTESAYTEDIPARAKVGDAQARTRLAVLDVESGEVKWVEHGQKKAADKDSKEEKKADENAAGEKRDSEQVI